MNIDRDPKKPGLDTLAEPVEITKATPEDEREIWLVQHKSATQGLVNQERGVTPEWLLANGGGHFGRDGQLTALGEAELQKTIERLKQNPPQDTETFVAKTGGKIIGFCVVSKAGERNRLVGIYTDLEESKSRGIGPKLWEKSKQFLDPHKETIVTLLDYNTRAYNFYKRNGFQEVARRERLNPDGTALNDGITAQLIDMVKPAEQKS